MDIIASPAVLGLVPVVIGLAEVVKAIGLPTKYASTAAVILGVALAFLVVPIGTSVILAGLVVGLSASGLYSGTRALVTE